jgi:hypothetical protein
LRGTASLKLRWAQGILSVLRDIGAVGRGKEREKYLAYEVRPEVFGFHLWALYSAGLRGPELIRTKFWQLLLLKEEETRQAIRSVSELGWWRFTALSGVEEIRPTSESIDTWMKHGLG